MTTAIPSSALSHLGDAQIKELIRRYYAGEPIVKLLVEYEIQCRKSDLYRHFPRQALDCPCCNYCGGILLEILPSRSATTYGSRQAYCQSCGHKPFESHKCKCFGCAEKRKHAKAEHQAAVRKAIEEFADVPNESDLPAREVGALTLWQSIALLSLVRSCSWHSETTLDQLAESVFPLSPETSLTQRLLDTLLASNLVYIDPSSPTDAFAFADERLSGYDPTLVRWRIGARNPVLLIQRLESVSARGDWPIHWTNELENVCYALGVAECRQYARHYLGERGLREPGDTALRTLIENLLRDYSVAQICRVLWHGARSAADFLVRRMVNRQHASNFFVGASQRWADRARNEGWEVKPFSRNYQLDRSQMSHVLYDVSLGIGDAGFTEPVNGWFQERSGQHPSD